MRSRGPVKIIFLQKVFLFYDILDDVVEHSRSSPNQYYKTYKFWERRKVARVLTKKSASILES